MQTTEEITVCARSTYAQEQGGGLLADLILGHTIVGAVERDEFCQTVLRARQRDGFLPTFPIFDDVRAFDGRPWRGSVDLLAGGIPCQGFSCSGLGLGEFDPRNLWPDALRILRECRAPWFFLENVDRLTSFDYWGIILQDLAAAGYDARWCVLAAGDVGAPHLRKRIWLLATDTESYRRNAWRPESDAARQAGVVESGQQMADAGGQRWHQIRDGREYSQGSGPYGHPERCGTDAGDPRQEFPAALGTGGRPAEPDLGRMVDGLADRMDGTADAERPGWWAVERGLRRVAGKQPYRADRLRGLGNGQVALAAAVAFKLLSGGVI